MGRIPLVRLLVRFDYFTIRFRVTNIQILAELLRFLRLYRAGELPINTNADHVRFWTVSFAAAHRFYQGGNLTVDQLFQVIRLLIGLRSETNVDRFQLQRNLREFLQREDNGTYQSGMIDMLNELMALLMSGEYYIVIRGYYGEYDRDTTRRAQYESSSGDPSYDYEWMTNEQMLNLLNKDQIIPPPVFKGNKYLHLLHKTKVNTWAKRRKASVATTNKLDSTFSFISTPARKANRTSIPRSNKRSINIALDRLTNLVNDQTFIKKVQRIN